MKGVTSPTFCCTLFVPVVTLYKTGCLKDDFFFGGKIKKPLEIKRLAFYLGLREFLSEWASPKSTHYQLTKTEPCA